MCLKTVNTIVKNLTRKVKGSISKNPIHVLCMSIFDDEGIHVFCIYYMIESKFMSHFFGLNKVSIFVPSMPDTINFESNWQQKNTPLQKYIVQGLSLQVERKTHLILLYLCHHLLFPYKNL